MNVLVGVVISGEQKAYAVPKFEEMCATLFPDIPVMAVVDEPGRTSLPFVVDARMHGSPWATEIVYYGKETLKRWALRWGTDALIWQGVDCYYTSRSEIDQLLEDAEAFPIVGGLVAARTDENLAVCRTYDDPPKWFHPNGRYGLHSVRGYIGSDATVIRRDVLKRVSMDGYRHWHLARTVGDDYSADGPEEFFMRQAIRAGICPVVDSRVRPWHVHEDGVARRYPGQLSRIEDLCWEGEIVQGR
jgi:hypothetical protein